jgi:hypothetical protein
MFNNKILFKSHKYLKKCMLVRLVERVSGKELSGLLLHILGAINFTAFLFVVILIVDFLSSLGREAIIENTILLSEQTWYSGIFSERITWIKLCLSGSLLSTIVFSVFDYIRDVLSGDARTTHIEKMLNERDTDRVDTNKDNVWLTTLFGLTLVGLLIWFFVNSIIGY